MDAYERQARFLGMELGTNVASWAVDGNTDVEMCRKIRQGYIDGDPEVMDMCPSPLSMEQADGITIDGLLTDCGVEYTSTTLDLGRYDYLLDAFEDAFAVAYWNQVLFMCREVPVDE